MVGSFPFIGFIFDEFSPQTPVSPVNVKNTKTRFTLAKAGGCYPEGDSFSEAFCSGLESCELRYCVNFPALKVVSDALDLSMARKIQRHVLQSMLLG